jgi:integrase
MALPAGAETVALYVAALAKVAKPATIDLRLAAISAAHRAAGHDSPTKEEAVRLVRRGVRRTLGTAQGQVRPVTVPDLRAMLQGLGTDPAGCRDRALLLLGFAGALRRSELVSLDVTDISGGRWAHDPPSVLEDGPGGRRAHRRHPLRVEPHYLPGSCLACAARGL